MIHGMLSVMIDLTIELSLWWNTRECTMLTIVRRAIGGRDAFEG